MENNITCPCIKTKCARHGNCEECKKHHHEKGGLTYCERTFEDK